MKQTANKKDMPLAATKKQYINFDTKNKMK